MGAGAREGCGISVEEQSTEQVASIAQSASFSAAAVLHVAPIFPTFAR